MRGKTKARGPKSSAWTASRLISGGDDKQRSAALKVLKPLWPHHSEIQEVWDSQYNSQRWKSDQTEQSGEKGVSHDQDQAAVFVILLEHISQTYFI